MNLSLREEEIVLNLLKNKNGLAIAELTNQIHVSKRTIYRELSSLETSLGSLAIQLVKEKGKYRLIGSQASLQELQFLLDKTDKQTILQSVDVRQSALACKLLMLNHLVTIKSLANEFGVSVSTITQDLNTIENIFHDYQVKIARIKAKGIQVVGKESNIRRVISGILSSEINEYEFFNYLDNGNDVQIPQTTSQYFIGLLDEHLLMQTKHAVEQHTKTDFVKFSDSQLKQLIIILTVSAQRIQAHHLINDLHHINKSDVLKYQHLAIELLNEFDHSIRDHISLMELEFIAQQIRGMSFSISNNILLDDNYLRLSYPVKSLIKDVSRRFNYDFNSDQTLLNDLIAHIGLALKKRFSQLPEINNTVLKDVIARYPQLYQAVNLGIKSIFSDDLSQSEVAYVLIHFASAWEQQRQSKPLKALVVCANGIGTAKVLKNRLQKTVPEIGEYQVSRVADLNKLDLKNYNLILSTLFLPGFKLPYKVISPLLLDNEIREIKDYINTQFGVVEVAKPIANNSSKSQNFEHEFHLLYQKVNMAQQLLNNLEVKTLDNSRCDLTQTLVKITQHLHPRYVLDVAQVANELNERINLAPIGIPNTGLALLHTISSQVTQPIFAVYDLKQPPLIMGMDHQKMRLNRALIMLISSETLAVGTDLMGDISGSIIDSEENSKYYQTGNVNTIKKLATRIFLESIKQNWE